MICFVSRATILSIFPVVICLLLLVFHNYIICKALFNHNILRGGDLQTKQNNYSTGAEHLNTGVYSAGAECETGIRNNPILDRPAGNKYVRRLLLSDK